MVRSLLLLTSLEKPSILQPGCLLIALVSPIVRKCTFDEAGAFARGTAQTAESSSRMCRRHNDVAHRRAFSMPYGACFEVKVWQLLTALRSYEGRRWQAGD